MAPFALPESLSALSVADLATLEAEAVQAFDEVNQTDPETLTDANVADLERLAGAIQSIRTEAAARVTAAAARRDRAAAAAALVTASTQAPEEGDGGEEDDDEEDEDDEAPADDTQEAAVTGPVITASVPSVRNTRRAPVVRPKTTDVTILAAADVPGFASGSRIDDMKALARAFSARAQGLPRTYMPETYIRSGVATIERPYDEELSDKNRDLDPFELFEAAAQESRLPGGSLTASGGWCAPSETLYDLCVTESMDGLVSLPEITITRGGIRFTRGPAFSDIYANAGFFQTEAQAIAGTAKPCVEIQCPPFDEVRLDVSGICVKAPILTNAGYPELVRRWVEGTLVAQAHKESAEVINRMVAAAGAAQTLSNGAGSGFDLLTGLEWVATSQKYKYRAPLAMSMEVILPFWAKQVLKADLGLRKGQTAPVSDAELSAHFSARGLAVQYVYDWQALDVATAAHGCVAAPPANIQALIYPAGAFVKGTADVISLDAIYDSTNITQNMFTAAFAESGFLVANRCYDACLVQVPTCILGATGGDVADCLLPGAAVAGP